MFRFDFKIALTDVTALLHEPLRTFWAEEDTDNQRDRWDECASELKPPRDIRYVLDDYVGGEAPFEKISGRMSK